MTTPRPCTEKNDDTFLWPLTPKTCTDGIFFSAVADAASPAIPLRASHPPARWADAPWEAEAPWMRGTGGLVCENLPPMRRAEFTIEAWFKFMPDPSEGFKPQSLFDFAGDNGQKWSLELDEHGQLIFSWQENDGEPEYCRSQAPLTDWIFSGQWLHTAASFRNMVGQFSSPEMARQNKMLDTGSNYPLVQLSCTPAGKSGLPLHVGGRYDFTAPVLKPVAGTLRIGAGYDRRGLDGAICQVALTDRAKMDNQFTTLGAPEPENIEMDENIPCGSGRDAVLDEAGRIVFCGRTNGWPSETFWFHFKVEGKPGPGCFRFLSPRGNGKMAASAHISYDSRSWERIPDAILLPGRSGAAKQTGEPHFCVDIKRTPAWIACVPPYLPDDLARLESDLGDWSCFESFEIGRSGGRRPIPGWRISDPDTPLDSKQLVVLLGGQHSPNEIFAARVFDSMLRCLQTNAEAPSALKQMALLIIPVLNVDSFHEGGNTALNRNGINLNRNWIDDCQPETEAAMRGIEEMARDCESVAFGLDFHAGGINRNHVRGQDQDDLAAVAPNLPARQARVMQSMDSRMGFRMNAGRFAPLVDDGRFREWFIPRFYAPCFTVEFMGLSHFDPQGRSTVPMNQGILEGLGEKLWQVCRDCCV